MTTTTDTPRVWVGCLACYTAGRLVGEWIDADEAGDFTTEQVHGTAEQLARFQVQDGGSPHEELWVFDHEGFGPMLSGECSPMEAQRLAEKLAEVDDPDAFAAWFSNESRDTDDDLAEQFSEEYAGEWDNLADYAQELFTETRDREVTALLDQWPFSYIDWERAGNDLRGDVWTAPAPQGKVYVFRNV